MTGFCQYGNIAVRFLLQLIAIIITVFKFTNLLASKTTVKKLNEPNIFYLRNNIGLNCYNFCRPSVWFLFTATRNTHLKAQVDHADANRCYASPVECIESHGMRGLTVCSWIEVFEKIWNLKLNLQTPYFSKVALTRSEQKLLVSPGAFFTIYYIVFTCILSFCHKN